MAFESRDITDLIMFLMTMQDHLIKWPFDFMEGSFSLYILTLPSLVAMWPWSCNDFSLSLDLAKPFGHVNFWVEAAQGKSPSIGIAEVRYNVLILPCVL